MTRPARSAMGRDRSWHQRAFALATAGAALLFVTGCERDAPVEPPAPQLAPAPQAGAVGSSTGTSATPSAEAPGPGPAGTEYPEPSVDGAAEPAPPQHAEDSPANAPGDLSAEEENSQMPMAGQGHNYSGDARKAGQDEASSAPSDKAASTPSEASQAPADSK